MEIIERRGWPVTVHPLPPLLHNQPHLIADEVRALAEKLQAEGRRVVVGYADCGTYGALDDVCHDLGLATPPRPPLLRRLRRRRPGGQVLRGPARHLSTDGLPGPLLQPHGDPELGLDRHPDLRDTYFGTYTRVVWLAQDRDRRARGPGRASSGLHRPPPDRRRDRQPAASKKHWPARWLRKAPHTLVEEGALAPVSKPQSRSTQPDRVSPPAAATSPAATPRSQRRR